jgi:hypothetical protein
MNVVACVQDKLEIDCATLRHPLWDLFSWHFFIFAEPFIELASRQLPIHIGVILSFVRGKFRIAVQNVSNICLLCCSNLVDYDSEGLGRRSNCRRQFNVGRATFGKWRTQLHVVLRPALLKFVIKYYSQQQLILRLFVNNPIWYSTTIIIAHRERFKCPRLSGTWHDENFDLKNITMT